MTRASGHGCRVQCSACHHSKMLDLDALIAAGRGDVALVELPLVCRCGSKRFGVTVMAGRAYASDVVGGA